MKSIYLIVILTTIFSFCSRSLIFAQKNQTEALIANEYYNRGETEKALKIYREIIADESIRSLIHQNYLTLLDGKQLKGEAENYIKKILAQAPSNIRYIVDAIDFYINSTDTAAADKHYNQLEKLVVHNSNTIRTAAQFLLNDQHYSYAEELYLGARKISKDPNQYAIQLASLYRYQNETDKMINEYIKYAQEVPSRIRYVKSMLQLSLKSEEEINSLIRKLLGRIQEEPSNLLYADLLIWANLQNNNFYGAFIQARALDKRLKLSGENAMEIGELAIKSEAYEVAVDVFEYIVENFPSTNNYIRARELLIYSKQKLVEASHPIDTAAIRSLITEYDKLIKDLGVNSGTLPAIRHKALLHGFYLSETQKAIAILKSIIENPTTPTDLRAQSKLDLADLYIIIDEPWESALLYSQVEKSHKNEPIGEEAKLKNAKASYYTGNFKLAQEHLDVLKRATRREIANDAIDLSILIKDNSILDSAQEALLQYANIELLIYQNKLQTAEEQINLMFKVHHDHPIIDELYWSYAKIEKQKANYQNAIDLLDTIVNVLPYDILTDDALFEQANLYQFYLKNNDKAQALYQQLMVEFPGSVYVAESRKRFRILRGDFVN